MFCMTHKPSQCVFTVCSRHGISGAASPFGEDANQAFAVSAGFSGQPPH